MSNTLCKKCLFADYADSDAPCSFNLIGRIKNTHTVLLEDNYNYIIDYKCKYGFSIDTYKNNQASIGSIKDLENYIFTKNNIKYVLIIRIEDDSISSIKKICNAINDLSVLPSHVCLFTVQNNNTSSIIETITKNISNNLTWKINNFLFEDDIYNYISNIVSTNMKKNESSFFWINTTKHIDALSKNIKEINNIITIDQPKAQALIRSKLDWDGLFLSFDNYAELVSYGGPDIKTTIDNLEKKYLISYD